MAVHLHSSRIQRNLVQEHWTRNVSVLDPNPGDHRCSRCLLPQLLRFGTTSPFVREERFQLPPPPMAHHVEPRLSSSIVPYSVVFQVQGGLLLSCHLIAWNLERLVFPTCLSLASHSQFYLLLLHQLALFWSLRL